MIGEKEVNAAFDTLENSFQELAKLEDKMLEYNQDLGEFKEGSRKADQIKKKIEELRPKITEAQRAYRMAGMRADRVRLLLDIAKTAMGRD
jgi:uncharacterized coiled-coil DUF342 family protein